MFQHCMQFQKSTGKVVVNHYDIPFPVHTGITHRNVRKHVSTKTLYRDNVKITKLKPKCSTLQLYKKKLPTPIILRQSNCLSVLKFYCRLCKRYVFIRYIYRARSNCCSIVLLSKTFITSLVSLRLL